MKFELEILKDDVQVAELDKNGKHQQLILAACRKASNLASAELVNEALLKNDLQALSNNAANMMIVVASNLLRLGVQEPELEDFVYACSELVSSTRNSIDNAMKFDNVGELRVTSVMMEIVVRGICACTDVVYDQKFKEVAEALRGQLNEPSN